MSLKQPRRGARGWHPAGAGTPDHPKVQNEVVLPFEPTAVEPDVELVDGSELAALLREMVDQAGEFRELWRQPAPIWVRPSDRISTPTGSVSTTPTRIIEYQRDRLRVTLLNTSPSAVILYLAGDATSVMGPESGFPLAPGASAQIDTRAAISAYTAGGTATWSAILEIMEVTA
jgi:hypothetical protein